jgi:hypothetical protein
MRGDDSRLQKMPNPSRLRLEQGAIWRMPVQLNCCRCIRADSRVAWVSACTIALSLTLLTQAARAEDAGDSSPEPPMCSPLKPIPPELNGICEITPLPAAECHPISPGAQCHKITVNLTAHMGDVEVGGYTVKTEHYNKSYLTPVIEAMPGDTVAAHLENGLTAPVENGLTAPGADCTANADENPTNLHYFHGGIVSPSNDWPSDARDGTGDNIYVYLKQHKSHDFKVPIPGKGQLDARVLEGESNTKISHPNGLNWYHSHLHRISSAQVMGGMSSLLSVGEDKANVKAQCKFGRLSGA